MLVGTEPPSVVSVDLTGFKQASHAATR